MGYVEGEGCFSITVGKYIDRKPRKTDKQNSICKASLFRVKPNFVVTNIADNRAVLDQIKESLGGIGEVYIVNRGLKKNQQNLAQYRVQSVKECLMVADYFKELQFATQKGEDFKKWQKCLDLISQGKHTQKEGLLEICELRDSMNFRKAKSKRNTDEIKLLIENNPGCISAHKKKFIHNNSNGTLTWFEKKQGNNLVSK